MTFEKVKVFLRFYWLAFILLFLLSSISISAWLASRKSEQEYKENLFVIRTDQVKTSIERRLTDYIQVLKGARGLFNASGFVSRSEWEKYYNDLELDKNYPGIRGMGYGAFVKREDVKKFKKTLKEAGINNFKIFPEGDRPYYCPVTYIEPFEENKISMGHDMYIEPARKTAMDTAMIKNEPVLTGKVILLIDRDKKPIPSLLLFLPVYKNNKAPHTVSESKENILGFVYNPFRVHTLINGILKNDFQDIDIEIYAGTSLNNENMLYDEDLSYKIESGDKKKLTRQIKINLAHQHWEIWFATTSEFDKKTTSNLSSIILTGGLTISLLVFFVMIFFSNLRKAQAKINQESERSRFLLEAMPQKVWQTDEHGMSLYFNEEYIKYSGIDIEHLKGWGWKNIIHPDDWEENKSVWRHSLDTKQAYKIEHRLKSKENEYRWHLSRALPQKTKDDKVIMWVGTSTDIHDQKVLTEQLSKSNRDLDNFIYTASHDLKAPVSNIEGLITALGETLREKDTKDDIVSEMLEMIKVSLFRFQRTIRYLTEISKIQKNLEEDISEINLAEIVEDVKSDIKNEIEQTGAEIISDFTNCQIRFSRTNLRSIVYNLLTNSIKYRDFKRKPKVIISCISDSNNYILTVQDNGLGIRKDQQEKIFGMFKRAHSHVEGTGVGLYLVKRIIDNAGGKIELESEEGTGSKFSVYINKNH